MGAGEYLPVPPVPPLVERPREVARRRVREEQVGRIADVPAPVRRAGPAVAVGEVRFAQLDLDQDRTPGAIRQSPPEDDVDPGRGLVVLGPFPVQFAQDVALGHPLEPDILDGQFGSDGCAHTARQMFPVPFPEGEEKVEGEDLGTPEMGGVPVEPHRIVPDRGLGQFPVLRVDTGGPVAPVPAPRPVDSGPPLLQVSLEEGREGLGIVPCWGHAVSCLPTPPARRRLR